MRLYPRAVRSSLPPPYAPLRHASPLSVHETVTLDATVAKGLLFRKVNVKEAFTLLDAEGRAFRASLTSCEPDRATALVYEALRDVPESPAHLTLVCAVLQRQRMLWVAQKAAEIGVARIVPVFTLKSVQADGLAHEKAHAWPGQALKGARQCRRASVPEVRATAALESVFTSDLWRSADARIFLDDRADESDARPLVRDESRPAPEREIVLVVGPEGGFADVERRKLIEAGATPLRLGGRVLRAETAVMVGLTVVQHRAGDLGFSSA